MRLIRPEGEEHRPFENLLVALITPAQTVQQSFQPVAGQHEPEVFPTLTRKVKQALAN